jgi:cytochrome c biogenesis protein
VLQDNRAKPLDFEVRLDDFQVEYYRQGIPAEFRSDLTFFRNGQEVAKAVCRVNEPVTFGGLTFYQSSYGARPNGPVKLKICQGEDCHMVEAPMRQGLTLPGGEAQIMVVRLDGNLLGTGPAVMVAYKSGPGHPLVFWVSKNHPELAENPDSPFYQPGPQRLTLESLPFKFFSVFQVRRDPGVWWVYSGFLLCLPGFMLAFLLPAQRWAVTMNQKPDGAWEGRLLGASPRAREDFDIKTDRLLLRLRQK